MYVQVTTAPVRTAVITKFTAPDPWTASATADWQLTLYSVVIENQAFPDSRAIRAARARNGKKGLPPGRKLRGDEMLGLVHEEQHHMMPRALTRLWLAGSVPTERLPELLHTSEPTLRRTDYPTRDVGQNLAVAGFIFLALALVAFVFQMTASAYWAAALRPVGPVLAVITLGFFAFGAYQRGRDKRHTSVFTRGLK